MRLSVCTTVMILCLAGTAGAQTAEEHVSEGDRAYAALDIPAALDHYEKAVTASPGNYEALWKAGRTAIDLGTPAPDAAKRNALFARAEQYGRRAVTADPGDSEGHF